MRPFLLLRSLPVLLAGAFALPAQAARYEAEFMCHCLVTAMSADGRAATGQLTAASKTFYWQAGQGAISLGRGTLQALGKVAGGLPAISADGQWVASTILADERTHATQGRWSAATGWQALMPPRPADGSIMDMEDGTVFGMSRDGRVVTGLYWRNTATGGLAHGSRWTEGGQVEDMGSSGGSSRIDDANQDGSVLVGFDEDPAVSSRRAAAWRHGVLTVLDDHNDSTSEAAAVNPAGDVVVGQAWDPASRRTAAVLWRWQGGAWARTVLGVLPGTKVGGMAYANVVSDDGRLVAGLARTKFGPGGRGFIWTAETGLVDANTWFAERGGAIPPAYVITNVLGLSGDGKTFGVVAVHKRTGQQASFAVREVAAR